MALLLLESKRDDLLIPYFEIVKSKIPTITFGQFKSNLLEHLTQNGGLRNLSLASNYYLAGAARYYFNGDLTTNKNLALLYPYTPISQIEAAVNNGEQVKQNHKDKWKTDVCQILNKIILHLRNSYIDTLGEAWEQPEDFGTLPLDKLIKKYNSKVAKIKSDDDDKLKGIDTSNRVSKNYTFEIMYSHEDCKKFYEATNPGAWCITYGQNHYDYYVKDLNIHYVIFKRDGWEKVPRVPEKEKWIRNGTYLPKPQDTYGNSLIALLQSNRNGEPVYITSRWNHGSGDSGSVEADHAYSKEEFMRITGVTNAELKRIFEIWANTATNRKKTASELSEDLKNTVRKLKEFQMRINGGADIVDYMAKFGIEIEKCPNKVEDEIYPTSNLKKDVFVLKTTDANGFAYYFIMDKGKIIFESLCESSKLYKDCKGFITSNDYKYDGLRLENSIVVPTANYFMIYNYRYHTFVSVRGETKFKRVPLPVDTNAVGSDKQKHIFFEVKRGMYDAALINLQTLKPLVLPNGEVWFNKLRTVQTSYNYEPQNKIFAHFVGGYLAPVIEITYDMSSGEKYYYNCMQKRFFEINVNEWEFRPKISMPNDKLYPVLTTSCGYSYSGTKGIYGIHLTTDVDKWGYDYQTPSIYFDALTDKPIEVNGLKYFTECKTLDVEQPMYELDFTKIFEKFTPSFEMQKKMDFFKKVFDKGHIIYDYKTKQPLAINGKLVSWYEKRENKQFVFLYLKTDDELPKEIRYSKIVAIYDSNEHKFIKNESGFPNYRVFVFDDIETWGDYSDGIIGYYYPNLEVKNSEETIKVKEYTRVKRGSIKLDINKLTYYPNEFNDYSAEYNLLFGNNSENTIQSPEQSAIVQEDIERMVKNVLQNIIA